MLNGDTSLNKNIVRGVCKITFMEKMKWNDAS
jgi:hypothetical protein